MKTRRTFVLGWSGYIGSALCDALGKIGTPPVLVGRSPVSDIPFDIATHELGFLSTLRAGDKFVFLSAISSPDFCTKNYEAAYRVNVTKSSELIEALLDRGVEVLFASSDVVYGKTESPVTELDEINPQFAYAEMKGEVESRFKYHNNFKVMRLSYVWSLTDKFTLFLQQCHTNKAVVEVFHPFIRSVVCLDDVVDFIVSFVSSDGGFPGLVNLSGPAFLSRVQMVEAFSDCKHIQYVITYPESEFFRSRPEQILMRSVYLDQVLGRPPKDVLVSMQAKLSVN